ncbi:MAG: hypothetical protein KDB88_12725, partial [Flavobacteriales bacterium]|nr:hypothetical protein [Flavobacteriales bacterium]
RRFKRLDLEYECASDEFTTYRTLSEPISGIVEERPEYTNVTNGYGLMGSRYFNFIQGVKLGDDSQLELVTGQYTNDLLFCIDGVVGGTLGCD